MDSRQQGRLFGVSNTEQSAMSGTQGGSSGHDEDVRVALVTPAQSPMGWTHDRLADPTRWPSKGVLWSLRFAQLGWSRKRAAAFLGLHERSLRRLENGLEPTRSVYVTALRLAAGELGLIHPAWAGFRLAQDGRLHHEELQMAEGFAPGEILGHSYQLQYLTELERKCRRLEAELSGLRQAANQEEFGFDQEAANE